MRVPLRTGPTAVTVVLLVVLLLPQGAEAQEAMSITVTPSTGLEEGQTVTVTGGSFSTLGSPVLAQCAGPVDLTDVPSVLTYCPFTHAVVPSLDAEGNLVPTSYTVREVLNIVGLVPPGTTYDCTVQNDCSIAVFGFLSDRMTLVGVKAPIRFGPDLPTTKADCKNAGWRNLANDQGQPFRNQGQCVSYVVAHRR